MYTSFFGFKENPFSLTPDPRYLFLSPIHKEAIDHLLYGINERKGFIVITGGIGTGKTTLCRVLLSHLESTTKSALIFNSFISDVELLKTINQELGIYVKPGTGTKKDYIDTLNQFLLDTFSRGGNAVLLIDEAQNLSHDVLEQIRMLSNLETTREKLIQIVLVGQPELRELLSAPSMKQLNERVMVRYNLNSLTFENMGGYVEHRMVVAGGRGTPTFTRAALKEIYAYSGGNPRRINSVCDRSLLIAYAKGKYAISKSFAKKAVRELYGEIPGSGYPLNRLLLKQAFVLLVLIFIAGFGLWSYNRISQNISANGNKNKITEFKPVQEVDSKPSKTTASIIIDDQKSYSGLFSLFYSQKGGYNKNIDEHHLTICNFTLAPEYYVMLKKPFRVAVRNSPETSGFILISNAEQDGAVVIDADGEERTITRDFILRYWGGRVSWIFPDEFKNPNLIKGMRSPEVLELQKTLNDIGYILEPTGFYGESTYQNIVRFQEDFGLQADGIAGPRTRALLYQMAG
jgi:general secretion pathway protein A